MFNQPLESNRQMIAALRIWLGPVVVAVGILALIPPRNLWVLGACGVGAVAELAIVIWWQFRGRALDESRPPDPFGPRTQAALRGYRRMLANMPLYLAPALIGVHNPRSRIAWMVLLALYAAMAVYSVLMLIYLPRHPREETPLPVQSPAAAWGRVERRLRRILIITLVAGALDAGVWLALSQRWRHSFEIAFGTVALAAGALFLIAAFLLAAGEPAAGLTPAQSQQRLRPISRGAGLISVSIPLLVVGAIVARRSHTNGIVGWGIALTAVAMFIGGVVSAAVGIARARRSRQAAGGAHSGSDLSRGAALSVGGDGLGASSRNDLDASDRRHEEGDPGR